MDPITILAAFIPLLQQLGGAAIGKIFGPVFKPSSFAEYLEWEKMGLERFKTVNDLGVGETYPWVNAIIKLQRPAITALTLLTWCYMQLTGQDNATVNNLTGLVFFYLFGERVQLGIAKAQGAVK